MECQDCGRTYPTARHAARQCRVCVAPNPFLNIAEGNRRYSQRAYAIRDAAFRDFLAEEAPRANPALQAVHRAAFNAGWLARKNAQYAGETT